MPTLRPAFEFLESEGPRIFSPCSSMLYVGHRHDTHPWWYQTFAVNLGVTRIAVVDIDPHNAMTAQCATSEIYVGDVRQEGLARDFDLVFWDEGPEHVSRDDAMQVLQRLREKNRHVLISCPWGYQPQGGGPDDPEFHHWGPMPEDFAAMGWTTATFGTVFPAGHGNLLAWS